MDVYWSIELCGWVRSPGPPDPLVTPWSLRDEPAPVAVPVPDQRRPAGAPAER